MKIRVLRRLPSCGCATTRTPTANHFPPLLNGVCYAVNKTLVGSRAERQMSKPGHDFELGMRSFAKKKESH
jgi:hypothetical protein